MNNNYTEKTYEEIFLNALQDAFQEALISHDEEFQNYIKNREDIENFYVMLLAIHSEVVAKVYKDITIVYNSTDIDLAEQNDLDRLGKIVGIPRVPATKSNVDIKFTFSKTQENNIILPKGILCCSKKEGKYFRTVQQGTLLAGEKTITLAAESTNTGLQTKVASGVITKLETDLEGVIGSVKCINEKPSSGGRDAQTDEEYRVYLKKWQETHQKGNLYAYKYYFDNFNGIDSYHLIPNWDGSGTIKAVIDPGTEFLKKKVYTEIQEQVSQIDDDICVIEAEPKPIDIDMKFSIDLDSVLPASDIEKQKIKELIKSEVNRFIDGGFDAKGEYRKPLSIGEDFVVSKLVQYLHNQITDLRDILIDKPINYIPVSDEEVATTGNLNIEVL